MKMGQKMRQVIALCLLLCPILTRIQAQNTTEEVQALLDMLDCTETTCYNIKMDGSFLSPWKLYMSQSCGFYGMTPARPSDEETAKFLADLAKRTITDDSSVWLGLSQEETVNNSAFTNLWGTSQPQTLEDGKVAMRRNSGFKWEITASRTLGWSLCEIPKANVSFCVNDTCYNVYPTSLTNIEAVYTFCELVGERAAIPQTPELAKQVATYFAKTYFIAATGVFLNETLLTDENQNVIGNSDDWPFVAPPINKDFKCVLLLRGYFFQSTCDKNRFFPMCETKTSDEENDKNFEGCGKVKGRCCGKGEKGWGRRCRKSWK